MRIKQAIKESGSSVGELAQKMGVSRQAISRQINGANITISTVKKISDVLGLPVGQLFDQIPADKADHNVITCPHCGAKLVINLSVSDKKTRVNKGQQTK